MRRLALALASVLALAAVTPLYAMTPQNTAIPQIQPVVLGMVVSTTAHTVTVTTAEGEHMAFEFDSRTVKPMELSTGQPVRVEFRLLDSGLHFAQRITRIERGSQDWNTLQSQTGYYHDENESMEGSESSNDHDMSKDHDNTSNERHDMSTTSDNDNDHDADHDRDYSSTTNDRTEDELPATASELPWLLSIGLLLLVVVAAVMWLARRRSA